MPATTICGPNAEDRKPSRRLAPGRPLIWDRTKTEAPSRSWQPSAKQSASCASSAG